MGSADRRVFFAVLLERFDQDRVENPLPVPKVLGGKKDQRPQQLFSQGNQPGNDAAPAVDRKRNVVAPQPGPGKQVAGGMITEEVFNAGNFAGILAGRIIRRRADRGCCLRNRRGRPVADLERLCCLVFSH